MKLSLILTNVINEITICALHISISSPLQTVEHPSLTHDTAWIELSES